MLNPHKMDLIVSSEGLSSRSAKTLSLYARAPVTLHTLTVATAGLLKLSTPSLVSSNRLFRHPFGLLTEIVTQAGAGVLLGDSPVQKAQISSWVELSHTIDPQDLISHLDTHLLSRTFLVSNHITVADIVAYSVVCDVLRLGEARKRLINVFRWAKHLQSLPGFAQAAGEVIAFTAEMFLPENEEEKSASKAESREKEEKATAEGKPKEQKQPKEGKKPHTEEGKEAEKATHPHEESKKQKKQPKEPRPEGAPGTEAAKRPKKGPKEPKAESVPSQSSTEAKPASEESKKPEETKKPSKAPSKPSAKKAPEEAGEPCSLLDLRVGRIQRIWRHPTRDHLFCEEVDMGKGEVRTIASGLVGYVSEEAMAGSLVVILANLKPRKMDDFVSQGMVLCSSLGDGIEPLRPPTDSQPGDRIVVEGLPSAPLPELPPKKQYWEAAMKELKVDESGRATYKNVLLVTPLGAVRSPTFKAGTIS